MIASEEKSKRIGEVTLAPFNAVNIEGLADKEILFGWKPHFEGYPEKGVKYSKNVGDEVWTLHLHPEKGTVILEGLREAMLSLDKLTSVEHNQSMGVLAFTNPDGERYEISERGHKHVVKNRDAIRGRITI